MRKNLQEVTDLFYRQKRAIISFNIQSIDQLFYLHMVGNELRCPVMAQFSAKYIPYFDRISGLSSMVAFYRSDYLYFHLDHCTDQDIIKLCIDAGFDSVMFDGSGLPLQENIRLSNEVYQWAKNKALLEVELGSITGVEDGHGTDEGDLFSFTELERFHKEVNYDLLALAIGNAHGVYENTSGIQVDLLSQARDLIGNVKFVLHGGTGMEDDLIKRAIGFGVVKMNISTGLKIETFDIVNDYICTGSRFYDHLKLHTSLARVKSYFGHYIKKFTI